jgi:hypothetical protein
MRVCQFRHYGTVFYAPHRGPEHANRELLVLQTATAMSILDTLSSMPSSLLKAGEKALPTRLLLKKRVYY